MNDLRRKWKLNKRDIYWVAATEFGETETAHCHIIFNFYPLEAKGKMSPELDGLQAEAEESLDHVCGILELQKSSVDIHWQPKFDDYGLVNYVSKKEFGRECKHFLWSKGGHLWMSELSKYEVETTVTEVIDKMEEAFR